MKERILKYLTISFLCLVSSHLALCQKEFNAQKTVHEAIATAKEISLYNDEVNWDSLQVVMLEAAKEAKRIDDLAPAMEHLINGLRDHHGMVRKTVDYSPLAFFTDYDNARYTDSRERTDEHWAIVNDVESRFEYDLLPENIGYLKVVGVGGNVDGQAEAERIRNAIYELADRGADKWILDLRYNGGGNINVMLAGLAPLLADGEVATIRRLDGEIMGAAEIKEGNFWYFGMNAFPIDNMRKIDSPKIAVLTSRWTVSSGELTAVAFKGQASAKFFGEYTGGYTTNNSWDPIGEELMLVISTGVYYDRDGVGYDHFVGVDRKVEFSVESNLEIDPAIVEARSWLLK